MPRTVAPFSRAGHVVDIGISPPLFGPHSEERFLATLLDRAWSGGHGPGTVLDLTPKHSELP